VKTFTKPAEGQTSWQSEAKGEMELLRRGLVVLRPKRPYLDWARSVDPDSAKSLAQHRREDSFAFLVPSYNLDIDDAQWFVDRYWPHFFAQVLESWTPKVKHWPQERTLEVFRQWFDIELSDRIMDLGQYADFKL
jgi:hypothetical protein